jgi:hypothetical protein
MSDFDINIYLEKLKNEYPSQILRKNINEYGGANIEEKLQNAIDKSKSEELLVKLGYLKHQCLKYADHKPEPWENDIMVHYISFNYWGELTLEEMNERLKEMGGVLSEWHLIGGEENLLS